MEPVPALCMACDSKACAFRPQQLQRRAVADYDVLIEMRYCGVCHSDLHSAAGHLNQIFTPPQYPFVPGHELAGVVRQVGPQVTKFKAGDQAAVGNLVDACLECAACLRGEEQQCKKCVQTYGAYDWSGRAATVPAGSQLLGGYTSTMVVHERFALTVPEGYPLEMAGPVMCAGITSYEPLKHHGATAGTRVGIIGLGGLGTLGVRLAKALGCTVTVLSRNMSKEPLAKECGADHYIASGDSEQMRANAATLDLILNFVPTHHDYLPYCKLLAKGGKQVFLGLHAAWAAAMWRGGSAATGCCKGSYIGGLANTQEVLDLCAREQIYPEVTVWPCARLNEIFALLDGSNESGTRYVLDLATLGANDPPQPPPALKPSTARMDKASILKEILYMKFWLRNP